MAIPCGCGKVLCCATSVAYQSAHAVPVAGGRKTARALYPLKLPPSLFRKYVPLFPQTAQEIAEGQDFVSVGDYNVRPSRLPPARLRTFVHSRTHVHARPHARTHAQLGGQVPVRQWIAGFNFRGTDQEKKARTHGPTPTVPNSEGYA